MSHRDVLFNFFDPFARFSNPFYSSNTDMRAHSYQLPAGRQQHLAIRCKFEIKVGFFRALRRTEVNFCSGTVAEDYKGPHNLVREIAT